MPDGEMVEYNDNMAAQQAYILRKAGFDWTSIQEQLVAGNYVAEAPSIDALRTLVRTYTLGLASYIGASDRQMLLGMELARLDDLQVPFFHAAVAGDIRALDGVLKIMATRMKLTGMDQLGVEDKKTLNTVLIVGGDTQTFLEALEHGKSQILAGALPDDEDELEGDVL